MNEEQTNQKALELLSKRDWNSAQKLLFENANRFKSHNSYNNLGHYLVTEGLVCKDGRFLNAYNKGMKYLLASAEIKESATNAFAIASALNFKLKYSSRKKPEIFCFIFLRTSFGSPKNSAGRHIPASRIGTRHLHRR